MDRRSGLTVGFFIFMSMEPRTLSDTSPDDIIDAFQKAFGDYAVRFDRHEVESMLRRRGFRRDISWGAFADDGSICAFLLNGYGAYEGEMCCYDCGTGTLPEYRGLGLAGKLFMMSQPGLIEAGVRGYLLEVLTSNAPAVSLYKKAGFEIVAEYECYNKSLSDLRLASRRLADVMIEEIGAEALEPMSGFCDFSPSWQNSYESICRAADELIILAAVRKGERIGYCVYDPHTGDIAQIAVDRRYRRMGVGRSLMAHALQKAENSKVKVLNVDAGCESMAGFLAAVGFDKGLAQYGMRKNLTDSLSGSFGY